MEYDKQKSDEAKALKNFDKLEMALQASEYELAHPNKDLSEFFIDVERHINIPEARKIFEFIRK